MGNKLNDDLIEATMRSVAAAKAALIEATIRRVAAAKAAQVTASIEPAPETGPSADDAAAGAPGEADASLREAEVDRIESLIRRVAASKAARVADEPSGPSGWPAAVPQPAASLHDEADDPHEDSIEAAIRRVAAGKAAQRIASIEPAPEPGPPADDPAAGAPSEADASLREAQVDRVEAMIRRVAASKAARVADAGAGWPAAVPQPAASVDVEADDPHDDPIEATIRRVAAAKAAQAAAAADTATDDPTAAEAAGNDEREPEAPPPRPLYAVAPSPARRQPAPVGRAADEPGLAQTVSELRRELDATKRALEALTARVDGLGSTAARTPAGAPLSDDVWDDSPSLPRVLDGQPIRPAIFRDPPPQTATAKHLPSESRDVVPDTRPIPEPLPPLHAAPKRGFDLLPRVYRVTVEDKRRGVDLVPLHRALLGMDSVRDISLLSYSNGTAIVSLDTLNELNPDALCQAISRAMSRGARVEVHNELTMVVKLAEE